MNLPRAKFDMLPQAVSNLHPKTQTVVLNLRCSLAQILALSVWYAMLFKAFVIPCSP